MLGDDAAGRLVSTSCSSAATVTRRSRGRGPWHPQWPLRLLGHGLDPCPGDSCALYHSLREPSATADVCNRMLASLAGLVLPTIQRIPG